MKLNSTKPLFFLLLLLSFLGLSFSVSKLEKYDKKRIIKCSDHIKNLRPYRSWTLSDTINETSGLIYWNNYLYTHNDDTDNALYQITTEGKIIKRIPLGTAKNNDWEDIAQDENYMYIGDVGNNATGVRTDLKILRIDKSTLFSAPKIDTIWFDYAERILPSHKATNSTDYDCEALIVYKDSIYLFTKEWNSMHTTIYSIPKKPGKYRASKKGSFAANGLITGADFIEIADMPFLVLSGYSQLLQPFIIMCTEFEQADFFGGCVYRIPIKLNFHQIEGIALTPEGHLFLSNEYFKKGIETPAKLHFFNLKELKSKKRH
jgi:hypothetical protein